MGYAVVTDAFEGPFDVLLRLITEHEVDLYEIELASIVDAFVREVDLLQRLDLEVATEFLVIAAILVELKCRRLLPGREPESGEDQLELLEERDYLLARLVECTTFSAAGKRLASIEAEALLSWPRTAGPDERYSALRPNLLAAVGPEGLLAAALRALETRPVEKVDTEHVLVDEVTVAEVVDGLFGELPGRSPITFRELTGPARSRSVVVVHFLALLELYKRGLVDLEQPATFGELTVVWRGAAAATGPGANARPASAAGQGAERVLDGAELEYRG